MTTMDLKGISWVGDMYQRLETMCAEVEETMYQDTVKYVEDQMWTVGASVKKFYSDVMHDFLPPSSLDSVKDENPLVTVVCHTDVGVYEKPKVDNEKQDVNFESHCDKSYEPPSSNPVEKECTHDLVEIQNISALDNRLDSKHKSLSGISSLNASMTKDNSEEFSCSEPPNESDEPLSELRVFNSKSASFLEVSYSEEDGELTSEEIFNGIVAVVKVSETTMPSTEDASAEIDVSSRIADLETTITIEMNSNNVEKELSVSDTETSNPLVDSEVKSGDVDEQGVRQHHMVKLVESCVLVEKDEHSSKLPSEVQRKSYKKKITDVILPRRWSKGKREQDQLAVWYEEQIGKNSVDIPNSQTHESFESDWELI